MAKRAERAEELAKERETLLEAAEESKQRLATERDEAVARLQVLEKVAAGKASVDDASRALVSSLENERDSLRRELAEAKERVGELEAANVAAERRVEDARKAATSSDTMLRKEIERLTAHVHQLEEVAALREQAEAAGDDEDALSESSDDETDSSTEFRMAKKGKKKPIQQQQVASAPAAALVAKLEAEIATLRKQVHRVPVVYL